MRRANSWATACPPSGSRTRPHGSRGRTIPRTGRGSFRRFRGSMQRLCACSPRARRVHLIVENAAMQRRVTSMLQRAGANLDQVSFHAGPPIAAGRAIPVRSLFATREAAWHSPIGASTPGPSTTTGISTTNCPAGCEIARHARHGSPSSIQSQHRVASPGARRRVDRRKRRGHPAHDRGMSAERGAAAQSRREPRATGTGLSRFLGIDQVIWLGRGIAGDDTHGHVDDIARFAGPDDDRCRGRAQHERPEPRAAGGKSRAG